MTEKELAQLRAEAEEAQRILSGSYTISAERERKLIADYGERCAQNIPELLAEVEHLRAIARAVAGADNSESSVCYQLCDVRFIWDEHDDSKSEMIHRAPCVVEKARAVIGIGPLADAESD